MIKSIDHFGITVSNIENAARFFCDYLGFRMKQPIRTSKSKQHDETLQMSNVELRQCMLMLPDSDEPAVELHEYVNPKGKIIDLKTCNVGVTHLCFTVNDIEKMYEDLTAKGVTFNNKPKWISTEGPEKNSAFCACYLKGPDGITLAFIERKNI